METFIIAANGRQHDKFTEQSKKLILCDRNWNDFGYYTLHELFLIVPDKPYNIKLADIRIFNYDQKFGEHPSIYSSSTHTSYISNIDSAERLVLFLTPKERKELLAELHVNFTQSIYANQQVFLKSVLRDITMQEFENMQLQIKEIVTTNLNITQMIADNIEFINMKG